MNQLTYSWNNVNVYTQTGNRRSIFGKFRQAFTGYKRHVSEKHILKQGKLSINVGIETHHNENSNQACEHAFANIF